MLTCTQTELHVLKQRYQDLQEKAEQRRLIREARSGRPSAVPVHGRLLAWLGRWMIQWGWRLQSRYGVLEGR